VLLCQRDSAPRDEQSEPFGQRLDAPRTEIAKQGCKAFREFALGMRQPRVAGRGEAQATAACVIARDGALQLAGTLEAAEQPRHGVVGDSHRGRDLARTEVGVGDVLQQDELGEADAGALETALLEQRLDVARGAPDAVQVAAGGISIRCLHIVSIVERNGRSTQGKCIRRDDGPSHRCPLSGRQLRRRQATVDQ